MSAIALPLLVPGALLALEPPVDDVFILYRYVNRFVNGKGFTSNDGEHVEGVTSLLWTVLISTLALTGTNPLIASVMLNLIIVVALGMTMIWCLYLLRLRPYWFLIALLLLGSSFLYFKVLFLGLGFGLYTLLLLLPCALLLKAID